MLAGLECGREMLIYKGGQMYIKYIIIIISLIWCVPCWGYSVDQLADAIYKAENSKTHPYGILAHYKHTTSRQACINTINHAKRDWDGRGDFIIFLASRYAPIGVKNDPNNLNKNWIKNVKYFLDKFK
jgi:NRPS condensation-like uncharacterized protein